MAENDTATATATNDTPTATAEKPRQATSYIVFSSETNDGPWARVGVYDAGGQGQAKKLATVALGQEKSEQLWFIAVPRSSYNPQKPTIDVQTTITF